MGATAYRVYGGLTGQSLSFIGTTSATSLVHSGLVAQTSYSYYVVATSANGDAPASATVSASTLDVGEERYWKFDDFGTSAVTDSSAWGSNGSISASATYDKPDKAPIFRKTNVSSLSISAATDSKATIPYTNSLRLAGPTFSVTAWVRPTGNGAFMGMRNTGCGAVSWEIGADAGGLYFRDAGGTRSSGVGLAANAWSHIGIIAGGGTMEFFVNGVQVNSVAYATAARAILPLEFGHPGSCAGAAFKLDDARILSRKMSGTEIATLGTRPPAPTLAGTAVCSKKIDFTWNAIAGATKYYIFKDQTDSYLTSLPATPASVSIGSLAIATAYTFSIISEVNNIYSEQSNILSISTLPIPPAPASLTAAAVAGGRINVTFPAESRATAYRLYMSTNGGAYAFKASYTAAGTFAVAGLTAGQSYSFVVRSVDCSSVESADSVVATATAM